MRLSSFLPALLLLVASPLLAQAPAPVSAPASTELAIPPDVVSFRMLGKLLIGVTRSGKLVAYDATDRAAPVRKSETDVGGKVTELRVADGIVLAVTADNRLHAFLFGDDGAATALQLGTASTVAATPAPRGPALLGKVVEARRGSVLIEFDAPDMVVPGDKLLVRSQGKELRLNLMTGQEEAMASNAATALVEVTRVDGRRAVADMHRGDVAAVGDTVQAGEKAEPTSMAFPHRGDFHQWARATVRPMLNTANALDVATLTDIAWGYYRDWYHVQVRIQPFTVSVPHAVDFLNLHAIAAYSSDFAEFGVGFGYFRQSTGATSVYGCNQTYAIAAPSIDSTGNTVSNLTTCTASGPSFVQHLRLGAVDGFNIRLTNTTLISSGFHFGYFDGSMDIPVSRLLNLYLQAGGSTGFGFGEFGVRTYFRGVGGKETLILTTGVGGTGLTTSQMFNATTSTIGNYTDTYGGYNWLVGPHFAVGVEYRF